MTQPPLAGRAALVCGASQGIGRATALALAARGADVTVLARRAERLEALLPELREAGAPYAEALPADLDDLGGLSKRLAERLARGPVHVVVNNTGAPPSGLLLAASVEGMGRALSRHLFAAHTIMQAVLPGMEAAGYGRFVQVLSTSVREPIPNIGLSNISRAAVASWAKTLSRELPPGITINNVLPGFTDTERLSGLAEEASARTGLSRDDVYANYTRATPEGRLGRPAEIAAAIAFLCSPDAAFIRGVSLAVDGGRLHSI